MIGVDSLSCLPSQLIGEETHGRIGGCEALRSRVDAAIREKRVSRMVSVVIPVFNNEASLDDLFQEIDLTEKELARLGAFLEIVCVDDGSTDDSLEILLKFQATRPAMTVVELSRNFGAIAAAKQGLHFVHGDCFTTLAADLQDPPTLVATMVEQWLLGADYVLCVRETRQDPWTSRVLSSVYYSLVRRFVFPNYPPGGFDLALMDQKMLPHLLASGKNVMTPLLGFWLGFTPTLIGYHRRSRATGKSTWSLKKRIKVFLDAVFGFSNLPIRMASLVGGSLSTGAFVYGAFVFGGAILQRVPVEGFATIVILVTLLLGAVLLTLGVLGEYLWRILDQLSNRPESVVQSVWKKN